jgi:hypothetical protein
MNEFTAHCRVNPKSFVERHAELTPSVNEADLEPIACRGLNT